MDLTIFCKGWQTAERLVAYRFTVEVKAVPQLVNAHLVQVINHVEVFAVEIDLLINFEGERSEFRQPFNSRFGNNRRNLQD